MFLLIVPGFRFKVPGFTSRNFLLPPKLREGGRRGWFKVPGFGFVNQEPGTWNY